MQAASRGAELKIELRLPAGCDRGRSMYLALSPLLLHFIQVPEL